MLFIVLVLLSLDIDITVINQSYELNASLVMVIVTSLVMVIVMLTSMLETQCP